MRAESARLGYHSAMRRRDFLLGAATVSLARADTQSPSEILYNGNIYAAPEGAGFRRIQALAIVDGKIVAAGDNAEIKALAGAGTRKTDLAGKTVLPGFIDAHTHIALFGVDHLRSVACDLSSIAEIQQALRQRAAHTPKGE